MTLLLLIATVAFIIVSTTRLRLHPILALLLAALAFGLGTGSSGQDVLDAIAAGFGGTIGQIGLVILLGAIIGTFLEQSGGAVGIAEAILRRTGNRGVPATLSGIGFVVSIPVFCDTAFIILSSIARALCKRTRTSHAAGVLALALGLFATHTMVPPTPGPVAAAGILGADLGLVIACGIVVAMIAALAGLAFSLIVASRVRIDASSVDTVAEHDISAPERHMPGVAASVLPVIVPLALIVLRSVAVLPDAPLGSGTHVSILQFIGQPVIALLIGVVLAMRLPEQFERSMLSSEGWVGKAIGSSATIILITGAGGAFGRVLQQSDLTSTLGEVVSRYDLGLLLPFVIAAAIKTAQGSSTVAMITTASLVAPLMPTLGFDAPVEKALATIAIGAGAMVVSHVNDSYFWVVTQFSGMNLRTGLRLMTAGTLVQGAAAGLAVWMASLFLT